MLRQRTWLFSAVLTAAIVVGLYVLSRDRESVPIARGPGEGSSLSPTMATDRCATCHKRETPTIVEQWARSTHAAKRVLCADCHEAKADQAGAKEHFGTYIVSDITSRVCAGCHPQQTKEIARSRHGLPAWTALVGYQALDPKLKEQFDQIEEVRRAPQGGELPTGFVGATRNALYDLEGPAITKMACQACHGVGQPNADGSVGRCNACHLRHEFSIEQARRPETCSRCHIGPDHPQWEIYEESSHGILYHIQGDHWNWSQKAGRLGVKDIPAATCQVCHMSGFGPQPTTHDVGDRLSWFLFAEVSEHRPNWSENRQRMVEVCSQCHSQNHISEEYRKADAVTVEVNSRVTEAKTLFESLIKDGLLSSTPFDHPLKFTAFNLWHHWGRTAKFGAWMQGPDYAQWHGIYPLMQEMATLREGAERLRAEAGKATGEKTTPEK